MPRVIVMMLATPIVGRIYNAVSPRIIIGAGIGFIAWGAFDMSHFTLESGQRDVIWAIMTQGIGFSCLFVPLSTVALSQIPRHKMADATGLNSLFRQVGGSLGLAIGATLLTRFGAQARTALVSHVTSTEPTAMSRLAQTARAFAARGVDMGTARDMALRALDGVVERQSSLLAFDRVFLLAGLAFLFVLPLLAYLKMPKQEGPAPKVDVHLE
jgi:DHA2 family multidrug resistance protein